MSRKTAVAASSQMQSGSTERRGLNDSTAESAPALPVQAVADLNRQTGANVDPNADPGDLMQSNARGLMAAVSSLPELTERKRAIDKHMNLATHMLKARCPPFSYSMVALIIACAYN